MTYQTVTHQYNYPHTSNPWDKHTDRHLCWFSLGYLRSQNTISCSPTRWMCFNINQGNTLPKVKNLHCHQHTVNSRRTTTLSLWSWKTARSRQMSNCTKACGKPYWRRERLSTTPFRWRNLGRPFCLVMINQNPTVKSCLSGNMKCKDTRIFSNWLKQRYLLVVRFPCSLGCVIPTKAPGNQNRLKFLKHLPWRNSSCKPLIFLPTHCWEVQDAQWL